MRSMMVHAAMLKRIYDWCLDAADKPYALWILAAVAFAESSFFPIPPDIMLLPMSLARPKRAWVFATVCTIASVAGGVLGYAIGALLYDSVGHWLIDLYGLSGKVEAFRASYAEWGALIIIGKGLTPIPYKLVTITSGFAGYNIWLFVVCSVIAASEEVNVVGRHQTEPEFAGEFREVRIALLLLGHSVIVQFDEKIPRPENVAIFRGQILRFFDVVGLKSAVDLTRETTAQADQPVGMRRQQFLVDARPIIKTI